MTKLVRRSRGKYCLSLIIEAGNPLKLVRHWNFISGFLEFISGFQRFISDFLAFISDFLEFISDSGIYRRFQEISHIQYFFIPFENVYNDREENNHGKNSYH
ncbi:hypothetical protein [Planococcus beigongshangi]|uniref:hypothetical protein n=1 Tax=Planococcus beigongshangi TaxID=2782536 RepID=UPI00193B9089|nr:hypothetical protein [Planococcus beigongshangi]